MLCLHKNRWCVWYWHKALFLNTPNPYIQLEQKDHSRHILTFSFRQGREIWHYVHKQKAPQHIPDIHKASLLHTVSEEVLRPKTYIPANYLLCHYRSHVITLCMKSTCPIRFYSLSSWWGGYAVLAWSCIHVCTCVWERYFTNLFVSLTILETVGTYSTKEPLFEAKRHELWSLALLG